MSIKISLTDFIEFVNKSGTTKLTQVKTIKNRDPYHPATDFYKALREGIILVHTSKGNKNDLDKLLSGLTDEKKKSNYPDAIKGYKKFWGKRKAIWFTPPAKIWKVGTVEVKINPELGLELDGKFYIIKLYMKSEKLTKNRVDQVLSLMESQLRTETPPEVIFCVLDMRTSKLYENITKTTSLLPLLEGEIRSFETIWNKI